MVIVVDDSGVVGDGDRGATVVKVVVMGRRL